MQSITESFLAQESSATVQQFGLSAGRKSCAVLAHKNNSDKNNVRLFPTMAHTASADHSTGSGPACISLWALNWLSLATWMSRHQVEIG